ncbi:MAG TPA: choice-of-anchor B family protein [Rubricoccaceae bacterium]|nr:choice-of-anchor B family protein [Rubricoccaceae bacterium]
MLQIPITGRLLILFAAAALVAAAPRAQILEHVGTVEFPNQPFSEQEPDYRVGGSDVWGYTAPDGTEYALMGVLDGLAIVQVPSMEVVAHVPGPEDDDPYFHRDIKTFGHYAYVVAENLGTNEGLQVIDLSGLPESVELVSVHTEGVVSSHNLSVDAETGFLYVLDSDGDGVHVIDASDPRALRNVSTIEVPDVHDVLAVGDRVYVAEGRSPTFSIWDLSDKEAPAMISRVTIPDAGYVHNIWPTDDGRYVLTTEETADKTVKVWDVSDPENVTLVGEWLGANRIAHNVHVRGRYAFLSHYAGGVIVVDIADPANPVEVARYDTTPEQDEANFTGTWGTTLPSPAGYVYGSDLDGRLTVLRFHHPEG